MFKRLSLFLLAGLLSASLNAAIQHSRHSPAAIVELGELEEWVITTQSDWALGSTVQISTSASPGDIVLSSVSFVDTSAADFAQGTMVNMDTTTLSGSVRLSTSNTDIVDNGFETGLYTGWYTQGRAYTYGSGVLECDDQGYITAQEGSLFALLQDGTNFTSFVTAVRVYSATGTLLGSGNYTINYNSWHQYSIDLSAYAGKNIYIAFRSGWPYPVDQIQSNVFYCSGGTMTFWAQTCDTDLSAGQMFNSLIDNFQGGSSTNTTGSFLSRSFDMGTSSPSWMPSGISWTANGNTFSAQTQSSDNGSTWDSLVDWSTGSAPGSANKEFVRYKVNVSTGQDSSELPYFSDSTMTALSTPGYWTSQEYDIGAGAVLWDKLVSVSSLNGGNANYWIRTATSSAMLASATWERIIPNGGIASPILRWVQLKVSLEATVYTQNPAMNELRLRWYKTATPESMWTQEGLSAFTAGTSLDGMTATQQPDYLVLQGWTGGDSTSDEFASGTLFGVSTVPVDGSVYLSTPTFQFPDYSFEDGSNPWVVGGSPTSAWAYDGTYSAACGGYLSSSGLAITSYLYAADGTLIRSPATGVDLSTMAMNTEVYLSLMRNGSECLRSANFICQGGTITFQQTQIDIYPPTHRYGRFVDYFRIGYNNNIPLSGEFLSRSFDTTTTQPQWSTSGADYVVGASTIQHSMSLAVDLSSGTLYNTLVAASTSSVLTSTLTVTDTLAHEFLQGSLINMTTYYSGKVTLNWNNSDIADSSFDTPCTGPTWSHSGSCTEGACGSPLIHGANCYTGSATGNLVAHVLDDGGGDSGYAFIPTTDWQQGTIPLSAAAGKNIQIMWQQTPSGESLTTSLFNCSGTDMTFYYRLNGSGNLQLDWAQNGLNTIYNGTYVSRGFDSLVSSPTWLASTPTWTQNGQSTVWTTEASSNGTDWDAGVAWSTGSAPASASKRYLRYRLVVSTVTGGTGRPSIDAVPLSARIGRSASVSVDNWTSLFGSWVGPTVWTPGMSAYGVFKATSVLNGATITYGLYTDSDTNKTIVGGIPVVGTYISSQTILSDGTPTLSTASFVFPVAYFNVTTTTTTPRLDKMSFDWTGSSPTVLNLKTQGSDDGVTWGALVDWSTASVPAMLAKRHLRYKGSMTAPDWSSVPGINSVDLSVYMSTGTWVSPTHNLGTVSAWGNFETTDVSDGATLSYYVRTAATEGGLPGASWVGVTPGSPIGATVNNWIQIKVYISRTAAQHPSIYMMRVKYTP